jgi:hypothetical protein
MTEPKPIDPERLAALIDGRLNRADAAAIRAQLATGDDDAISVLADAIAIADPTEHVLSIARPRAGWRLAVSLSAAAAVLLVTVLTRGRWQQEFSRNRYLISAYAAAVPSGAPLPATPVWGSSRGSAGAETEVGRSIRLGALATDLQVATARNDTASQRIADAFAAEIAALPGIGSLPNDARTLARDHADSAHVRETIARASDFGDAVFVFAGAWLEAARLASARSDSTFFSLYPADRALAPLQEQSISAARLAAIERVIRASGTRPRDFDRLTDTIAAALAAFAQ